MRSIVAILLLIIGALLAIYALTGLTASVMRLAEWVSDGDWSRIGKVSVAIAVSGTAAYFSLRAAWRRRADILVVGRVPAFVFRRYPYLPLPVILGMAAASLIVAALIVAFFVNPIELPDFVGSDFLPWDPTHTARKYVWLAVFAVVGAYLIFRYGRRPLSIALIPTLMLTLALPIGAAGYECLKERWGFAYWVTGYGDSMDALRRDPYVYLQDRKAATTYAVRISPNALAGLQFLRATGASGDWSALEEAEADVGARRQTGYGLLILFAGLVAGSGWLVYRDRTGLVGAGPD